MNAKKINIELPEILFATTVLIGVLSLFLMIIPSMVVNYLSDYQPDIYFEAKEDAKPFPKEVTITYQNTPTSSLYGKDRWYGIQRGSGRGTPYWDMVILPWDSQTQYYQAFNERGNRLTPQYLVPQRNPKNFELETVFKMEKETGTFTLFFHSQQELKQFLINQNEKYTTYTLSQTVKELAAP